jgi:hypothetical protein
MLLLRGRVRAEARMLRAMQETRRWARKRREQQSLRSLLESARAAAASGWRRRGREPRRKHGHNIVHDARGGAADCASSVNSKRSIQCRTLGRLQPLVTPSERNSCADLSARTHARSRHVIERDTATSRARTSAPAVVSARAEGWRTVARPRQKRSVSAQPWTNHWAKIVADGCNHLALIRAPREGAASTKAPPAARATQHHQR